jgi:hypothetical protein
VYELRKLRELPMEIVEYIALLLGESFEGWTEEAKQGYFTACISIKQRILNRIEVQKKLGKKIKEVLHGSSRVA